MKKKLTALLYSHDICIKFISIYALVNAADTTGAPATAKF